MFFIAGQHLVTVGALMTLVGNVKILATELKLRNSSFFLFFFTKSRLEMPFLIHANAAGSLCSLLSCSVRRVPECSTSQQKAQCRC